MTGYAADKRNFVGAQVTPIRQVGRTIIMPPETAADLRAAATLMRQRGQCWDTYEDDDGHVCSRGALLLAITGDPHPVHRTRERTPAEQTRIRNAEQAYRVANGWSTVKWHDEHEGLPQACLAAMERAAEGVVQ